jgi:sugar-specific transcriptional regulator TrmB
MEKILEKTGLNKSESNIYLTLLKIGNSKAGGIAKETGLNRTTVYKALENLIQRGLVSYVLKENRKYYAPSDPKNILQYFEREEKSLRQVKDQINEILPEMDKLFESIKDELEANIFKTTRGLKTVFNDIINTLKRGDEYLAFGVPEYSQIFWGYFEEFCKKLRKKKIKHKIIFDERATKNIESCKKYGFEVRTLSRQFMSLAEINIYSNKVAIVLWSKTPLAIQIKEREIAKSFRQYFNLLWSMASKAK